MPLCRVFPLRVECFFFSAEVEIRASLSLFFLPVFNGASPCAEVNPTIPLQSDMLEVGLSLVHPHPVFSFFFLSLPPWPHLLWITSRRRIFRGMEHGEFSRAFRFFPLLTSHAQFAAKSPLFRMTGIAESRQILSFFLSLPGYRDGRDGKTSYEFLPLF